MWYVGVVESPFEAAATGRAMAKGRSLSQFQEDVSRRGELRSLFVGAALVQRVLFAPAVAGNARRR